MVLWQLLGHPELVHFDWLYCISMIQIKILEFSKVIIGGLDTLCIYLIGSLRKYRLVFSIGRFCFVLLVKWVFVALWTLVIHSHHLRLWDLLYQSFVVEVDELFQNLMKLS